MATTERTSTRSVTTERQAGPTTAAPAQSDERGPGALDAARAARHTAALSFRATCEAGDRLRTKKLVTDANGVERKVDDAADYLLESEAIEAAKREAAYALRDASARLQDALVSSANAKLSKAAPLHEEAVERVERARKRLETKWCELLAASWALGEAAAVERASAGKLVAFASDASPSDEVRRSIRHAAPHTAPVAVDPSGPTAWQDRASLAAFGGYGDGSDVRRDQFWQNLGQLARESRAKALGLCGDVVRLRLEKALKQTEGSDG